MALFLVFLSIVGGAVILFLGVCFFKVKKLFFGKSTSKNPKSGYFKIAPQRVVWRSTLLGFISFREYTIDEADYDSFTIINRNFAKDKRYAYYQQLYFSVDLSFFEPINSYYSKDQHFIYFKNVRLPDSNAANVAEIEPFIVADAQNVYYQSTLISRHASQFTKISHYPNIYKAPDVVFFDYHIFEEADAATFEQINSSVSQNYFRDKTNVYFFTEKLKQADSKTFMPLNTNYGRDKKRIFFQEHSIKEADYDSFNVLDTDNALDKNNRFFQGKKQLIQASEKGTIENPASNTD
ncbi:DKNYY domain-containing protein [Runella sp.]|uniref:DKNYY domain-containing protein n=1 Tax=Runella sp. TaxID=1960881 RepID=UPI003D0BAEDE